MSFWSTSTGESAATDTSKEYEAPSGNMDPIPDGSTVLAFIKDAKWEKGQEMDGSPRYINLQWKVEEPSDVNGRVVFQKLWVSDADPNIAKDRKLSPEQVEQKQAKKRDNALKMLASIDANCGGKLAADGGEPTNDSLLIALANKPMAVTVKVWEMKTNDGMMTGNWICAVAPKGKELKVTGVVKGEAKQGYVDLDDDLPF